jgi:hypothetical protein
MSSPFGLVIALLTVESSYLRNVEEPAAGTADTVQFCFTPSQDWRIKTYAKDHDIHVHSIRETGQARVFAAPEAEANSKKHYADVIDRIVVLEFTDLSDPVDTAKVLASKGLQGKLEIGASGVCFYNPDGARYHSQSTPR